MVWVHLDGLFPISEKDCGFTRMLFTCFLLARKSKFSLQIRVQEICTGVAWLGTYIISRPSLGPIYTKRQHQCCDNSVMMLAILLSMKSVESLQNGVATYFHTTPLISMRTKTQASSQSCRSIDVDAWCKWAFRVR